MDSSVLELREQLAHAKMLIAELKEEMIELKRENRYYRELGSLEKDQLYAALAKAQKVYKKSSKSGNNDNFANSKSRGKFATLEDMMEATREALTDNGLQVHMIIATRNDRTYARVILTHSSGQFTTSECPINPTDHKGAPSNTSQADGSCRSYKYRYAYKEITGVAVSDDPEDDDGEAEMNRDTKQILDSEYLNKEEIQILENALKGHYDIKQQILSLYKINNLGQIPYKSLNYVGTKINELIAQKKQ